MGLKPGVVSCLPCASLLLNKSTQVYFASLPPFMKPQKLRHLLEQHGDVRKLYMAPEGMVRV